MAELNERQNQLSVKLVYYGPAMSGKTTNLTRLHDLLTPDLTGDMMMLETEGDRTLFFDLFPFGFTAPSGLLVRMKVFTVPGQAIHDGTRKAVLSRADGVIFVADSRRDQMVNNASSFENLATNVKLVGLDLRTLPLVVQFNKRDLPDILDEQEIRARWANAAWPLFFASALQGDGVVETFTELLGHLFDRLDASFFLEQRHGLCRAMFIAAAGRAK